MAGAGYKLYATGDVLTAADVNTYLQEQTVMRFASSAARTTALASVLAEGMLSYLIDTDQVEVYNGSAWVGVANAGDITGVTAGTGISGGGTSGTVTVTNSMATAIDAKGDLIGGTGADTFARLAVGANNTVLTADSAEATGLKWAAPTAAASITLLSTTNITATTEISITSISQAYTSLIILIENFKGSVDTDVSVRLNADTGNNYIWGIRGGSSGGTTGVSSIDIAGGVTLDGANDNSTTVIELPFYTSTASFKTGTVNSIWAGNNSNYYFTAEGGFGYKSTSAITSFQWRSVSNWAAQGTIKIYGVK